MATSYVEQATLKLTDETSGPANRINSALKQLYATARALKSTNVNVRVQATGLSQTRSAVATLARDVDRLSKLSARSLPLTTVRVDSSQVQRAITRLTQMHALAGRAIPAIRVPTQQNQRAGGGGGGSVPFAGTRGFVQGNSIGALLTNVALTSAAFGAVHTAANALSTALGAAASAAAGRDRTALQAATQASEAQTKIFKKMGGENPPTNAPLPLTASQRQQLFTSLLGDVTGAPTAEGEGTKQAAENRATAATNLVRMLEKDFLPRIFAARPETTQEQAVAGLRNIVKAMNLSSSDVIDATGQLTKSGERAAKGISLAMAIDPDLQPNLIKTTLANFKTGALTASEEELAKVLINAGNRGVRAANEAFRAGQAGTGTIDVKQLNNALANLGLLIGTERNKKGNVIAGSGRAVDQELLTTDPSVWFNKNFLPKVEAALSGQGREINDANVTSEARKMLPGLSAAAVQGITDMMLGQKQVAASIAQGRLALEQKVSEAVAASWTAQAENVATAWKDAAGSAFNNVLNAIGAPKALSEIASVLRGDQGTAAQVGAGAGVVGAGAGIGALGLRAMAGPLFAAGPQLNAAGVSLQGAAAALTRAAAVQAARGAVPSGVPSVPGTPGTPRGPGAPSTAVGIAKSIGVATVITTAPSVLGGGATPPREQTDADKAFAEAQKKVVANVGDSIANALAKVLPESVASVFRSKPATAETAAKDAAARAAVGEGSTGQVTPSSVQAATKAAEDAGTADELKSEIAKLTAAIAQQKAAEKIPGTADIATQGMQNQLAQLNMQLAQLTQKPQTVTDVAAKAAAEEAAKPAAQTQIAAATQAAVAAPVQSEVAKTTAVADTTAIATKAAEAAIKAPTSGTGFKIDTDKIAQNEQGNKASNSLFSSQTLASQSTDASLTKTAAPNGALLSTDVITQGASVFQQTFQTGAQAIQQAGATIDQSAQTFGPTAAQGILAAAGPFGATVAAAISAAASNISVNVKASGAGPNTGGAKSSE